MAVIFRFISFFLAIHGQNNRHKLLYFTYPNTRIIIIDVPKSRRSVRDLPLPVCMMGHLIEMKKAHNENDYYLTGALKYTEPRSCQYRYKKLLC